MLNQGNLLEAEQCNLGASPSSQSLHGARGRLEFSFGGGGGGGGEGGGGNGLKRTRGRKV